ncbi:DNA-binding protein H-NS [Paraburkholderia phenazinium]|uniref:DNA-binding protein H-NS n=1 Tax=Paraburkholderia phenazinium TaxID=60549 RepID=A0A1G8LX45_9BURK|nr:H-NS family nucleoid-associated regulatory protein [Paraburkholderia phenazinium]SDI12865.1 DNA-binding protein H-NS [Paraburkholderia phenazinium]SDI60203.1 DNA-binding protein H-NS [Paraburkholderia phenazinium]
MATLEQIQARLKRLQAQAEAIVAKQSSVVLEKIRGLMEKHGLTTADIDAHVGRKKRGPKAGSKAAVKTAKSVAKYRDPKSGATWSGHGRAPGWIANVKDRSKFLLDSSATSAAPAAAPAAATKAKVAGNYVRGPHPVKYRDPKSGATWSGRGRAPEWLAGAKDRTRFLIAGVSEVAESGVAIKPKTVAKKLATKTAVAKKSAAKKSIVAKKVVTKPSVAEAPEAESSQTPV